MTKAFHSLHVYCRAMPRIFAAVLAGLTLAAQAAPDAVALNTLTDSPLEAELTVLWDQGKHDQALERARQAQQAAGPGVSAREAATLQWLLAAALSGTGQLAQACTAARQAWQTEPQWQTPSGQDDTLAWAVAATLTDTCSVAGQGAQNIEPAASLIARHPPEQDAGQPAAWAALLHARALQLSYMRNSSESLQLLDRAITVLQRKGSTYSKLLYVYLSDKAVVLSSMGKYIEGLRTLDQIIPFQEVLLGAEHEDVLVNQSQRATILNEIGRSQEAADILSRITKLQAQTLGSTHPIVVQSTTNWMNALMNTGAAAKAADIGENILSFASETEKKQADFLVLRATLGFSLFFAGQSQRSVDTLETTLQDYLTIYGLNHPATISIQAFLAHCLYRTGNTEKAKDLISGLLKNQSGWINTRDPDALTTKFNVFSASAVYGSLPELDEIKKLEEDSVQVLGSKHLLSLSIRYLQARVMQKLNQSTAALTVLDEVSPTLKKEFGNENFKLLLPQALKIRILSDLAQWSQITGEAVEFRQRMNEYQKLNLFLGLTIGEQDLLISDAQTSGVVALAKLGRLPQALQALEEQKTGYLLQQMAVYRAMDTLAPGPLGAALRESAARLAALDGQIRQANSAQQRELLWAQRMQAAQQWQQQLTQAQQQNARFAALTRSGVDADAAQTAGLLNEDQVFVHYLIADANHGYALAVRPGQPPQWFDLGAWPGFASSMAAWQQWSVSRTLERPHDAQGRRLRICRAAAGDSAPARWWAEPVAMDDTSAAVPCAAGQSVSGEAAWRELGAAVAAWLIEPLRGALAHAQQVIISPSDAAPAIAWDLLPVDDAVLAQRWVVTQAPSLAYLQTRSQLQPPAGRAALLSLGYGEAFERDGQRWPTLAGAEAEARAAARLFAGQGAQALTGAKASKAALWQKNASGELADVRIVHLAAHGLLDAERPERQGLLLAGNGDAADGWLAPEDWLALTLRTDLVILSACEAGAGAGTPGEGLGGFVRALQLAGNRDVLASVWRVSDQESSRLVLNVLQRVRDGASAAWALAAAKRASVNQWGAASLQARTAAAFTLVGL